MRTLVPPEDADSGLGVGVGLQGGPESDLEGMPPEDLRRNMFSLVALEILFTVGAADLDIALNPLLVYLKASNTLIGELRSMIFISLIGLVISPYITQRFRTKKVLVLLTHIPYLGMWGLLGLLVILANRLGIEKNLLGLVFGLWVAQIFFGGFVSLPIQECIAACIPTCYRGRFTGFSLGIGGMASIGSAAIATLILYRMSKPDSFGWCFVYSWFFAQIAISLALLAREQPVPLEQQPVPWSRRMLLAAWEDTPFVKYMLFTILVAGVFSPVWQFLPIYGMKDLKMAAATSGLIQIVVMATRMLCSGVGGVIIDKLGPRKVLPVLPVMAAVSILPVLVIRAPVAVYVSSGLSAIYQVVSFTAAAALIYGLPRPENRSGHYAIYFILSSIATAVGSLTMGRAADLLTFRGAFLLYLALYVVFVPLSYYLVGPKAKGATV